MILIKKIIKRFKYIQKIPRSVFLFGKIPSLFFISENDGFLAAGIVSVHCSKLLSIKIC